jgi:hypothetical protein
LQANFTDSTKNYRVFYTAFINDKSLKTLLFLSDVFCICRKTAERNDKNMKLPNNYFKVEMKIFYENHNHIEKDFFRTKEEAEKCFSLRFEVVELGYLQSRFNEYSLLLVECDVNKMLTKVHKTRKAPL